MDKYNVTISTSGYGITASSLKAFGEINKVSVKHNIKTDKITIKVNN